MERPVIFDYDIAAWETWVKQNDFSLYRAKQIYQWCSKGVQDPDRMKNLPQGLREKIKEQFATPVLVIENEMVSSIDGTRKFVFRLHDGHIVETVLMKYKTYLSICISSLPAARWDVLSALPHVQDLAETLQPVRCSGRYLFYLI